MKIPQSGLRIDSPAFPLLQAVISYQGVTTSAGNALGTTLTDSQLSSEPSYVGLTVKILDGDAAGQVRTIVTHVSGTLTVTPAFTDSSGAVEQIASGIRFVILSVSGAGGAAPPVSPSIGLWMFGVCDSGMTASTTALVMPNLAGFPDDIFNDEFWAQVIHNDNSAGNAPEREIRRITDYVGSTGTFTCDAFSANVEADDLVAVFHESIAGMEIAGYGTLDTSSATVPADSARAAAYTWENDDYFNGCLLMPTAGNCRFQARRIVDYTNATGVFTLDPNNPLSQAPGAVDYVILRDQSEFVPAADGANNRTPSDVVGNKTDTIPAMNAAPGNDSLVRHLKAILERLGATPADPDDSVLTSIGQRDAAATLDDLSDVTTTDLQAKIRRILLRMSGAGVFSATIQGAARTELDTMLEQLATYFVAAGAAMALQINGNAARTNLEQALTDLASVLGADGANVFNPTVQGAARTDLDAAVAAMATYLSAAGAAWSVQVNGLAARTNLEQVLEDLSAVLGADGANVFNPTIQGAARLEMDAAFAQLATYVSAAGAAYSATVNPGAGAKTNVEQTLEDLGDVLAGAGITTYPAAAAPADGVSMAEVLRQIYDDVIAANSGFQEQADTAVNITAIVASETDVLNLAVAGTRYLIRHLRLKSADPGANNVTVRLYELINDVATVVQTYTITTANFGTYYSLMDFFGVPSLAGDNLRVTVQATGGAGVAVTGQYSHATAT